MRFVLVSLLVAVAMIATLSCEKDSTKPSGSNSNPQMIDYHARTSPDSVLMNLEIAHRFLDIDGYDEQIRDDYVFKPSPEDNLEFDELNQIQDHESTDRMFREVVQIEIELDASEPFASTREEEYPPEDGYMMIQVSAVQMFVETRDEVNGSPVTWHVNGDPALFIFYPDTTDSEINWTIVYQEDQHQ